MSSDGSCHAARGRECATTKGPVVGTGKTRVKGLGIRVKGIIHHPLHR